MHDISVMHVVIWGFIIVMLYNTHVATLFYKERQHEDVGPSSGSSYEASLLCWQITQIWYCKQLHVVKDTRQLCSSLNIVLNMHILPEPTNTKSPSPFLWGVIGRIIFNTYCTVCCGTNKREAIHSWRWSSNFKCCYVLFSHLETSEFRVVMNRDCRSSGMQCYASYCTSGSGTPTYTLTNRDTLGLTLCLLCLVLYAEHAGSRKKALLNGRVMGSVF